MCDVLYCVSVKAKQTLLELKKTRSLIVELENNLRRRLREFTKIKVETSHKHL
jgi:uncharacterized membrane protein